MTPATAVGRTEAEGKKVQKKLTGERDSALALDGDFAYNRQRFCKRIGEKKE